MKIDDLRRDYDKGTLDEAGAGNDPVAFFNHWLGEAIRLNVPEPTAMALSTVSPSGAPSSRMVLLKGVENGRFTFFSNYRSDKGKHLMLNPNAALLFFWPELERQVRIEGVVDLATAEESDSYFSSRPPESRISAIASPQSEVVSSREDLERMAEKVSALGSQALLKRPAFWGGYVLTPHSVEFWQGRAGRLHDRIRFRLDAGSQWEKERLAP